MKALSSLAPKERVSAVNDYYEKALPRLLTFEFSRDRKMMSVLIRGGPLGARLLAKGAPESVLERCDTAITANGIVPLTATLRAQISEHMATYAKNGLRTLALAYADRADTDANHYRANSTAEYSRFENGLTFAGLVGMLDPPRPEVRGAIAQCRAAGIRVIVITGDNKGTAEAICRQIGIFGENENLTGKSYTGRELDALNQDEKVEAVQRASLFSRTEPGHKSQLVDLLQGLGLVVAMVSRFSLSEIRLVTNMTATDWRRCQRRACTQEG